jgi:aspartate-semialdehyde dehydrogenase
MAGKRLRGARQEMKIARETRKILEERGIMVNHAVAAVPVYFGHSEAVHLETRTKITVTEAQKLLNSAPGVVLLDSRESGACPTAAAGYSDCRDFGKPAYVRYRSTGEI